MDYLSNRLADYFCLKKRIPEEKREIYNYGFKLILSDIINFTLVILLGLIINKVVDSVIFLISLCSIRRFSGGFHAKTFWLCRTAMLITFIAVIIISNFLILMNVPFFFIVIIEMILLVFIGLLSPIRHPNKKLTANMVKKNKKKAVFVTGVLIIISVTLNILNVKYGITIATTIFAVAILMILGIKTGKGGKRNV